MSMMNYINVNNERIKKLCVCVCVCGGVFIFCTGTRWLT